MNIELKNVTNVDKFFETLAECEGKVELVIDDGSRLNLKSTLSRYVGVAKVFTNGEIRQIELAIENIHDSAKMIRFMMNN